MVTVILGLSGLSCKERTNRLSGACGHLAAPRESGPTNGGAATFRAPLPLLRAVHGCSGRPAQGATVLNCACYFGFQGRPASCWECGKRRSLQGCPRHTQLLPYQASRIQSPLSKHRACFALGRKGSRKVRLEVDS